MSLLLTQLGCCYLCLCLGATTVAAENWYESEPLVHQLNSYTFTKLVDQSASTWLIEYYAPWCGHCKTFRPKIAQLARILKGKAKVGVVNCDDPFTSSLCSGVKGYPTFMILSISPKTGERAKPKEYRGSREVGAIEKKVLEDVSEYSVARLTCLQDAKKFVQQKADLPHVICFSESASPAAIFKGMALENHEGFSFAFVEHKFSAVCEFFGVAEFPAIVAVASDASKTSQLADPKNFTASSFDAFLKALSREAAHDL